MFVAYVKQFLSKDDGAVSVDYVVLTAAIITLGLIVALPVRESAIGAAQSIGAWLTAFVIETPPLN